MTRNGFPSINKAVAIQRCPYCKAIIDDKEEYCSNCGTRLLFPEDEFIEEEIPGEKIVDEEKEAAESKTARRTRRKAKKEEASPDDEQIEVSEKEAEGKLEAGEEPREDADLEEEKLEETDIPGDELIEPEEAEELVEEEELLEDINEEPLTDDEWRLEEQTGEEQVFEEAIDEEEKEEETTEIPIARQEIDFQTEDIEKIMDPAEKAKEEIEKFLKSLKEERQEQKRALEDEDEGLPPWAAKIKDASPSDASISDGKEDIREPLEEEEKIYSDVTPPYSEETTSSDTGMGIPETVGQRALPFIEETREEVISEKATSLRATRPSIHFSSWVKSRIFDVFFIGALWLIALWIASRLMEVSLFRLISASALSALGFYGILLVVYFFLFFLFLGETLGDHLFPQEE